MAEPVYSENTIPIFKLTDHPNKAAYNNETAIGNNKKALRIGWKN